MQVVLPATASWPSEHEVQEVAPTPPEVPAGQVEQVSVPALAEKEPDAQSSQVTESAGDSWPAAHWTQVGTPDTLATP